MIALVWLTGFGMVDWVSKSIQTAKDFVPYHSHCCLQSCESGLVSFVHSPHSP